MTKSDRSIKVYLVGVYQKVKKKVNRQTIAIIILVILLLATITFGGVYAYYSSSSGKVSGKIIMANLNISLESGGSASSDLFITNEVSVVPGQTLRNSELKIVNDSSAPIYLAVIYGIKAVDPGTGQQIDIPQNEATLNIGSTASSSGDWCNYTYQYFADSGEFLTLKCFLTKMPVSASKREITVIKENELSLPTSWGNIFQGKEISLSFRAYAIASDSFYFEGTETQIERCEEIMSKIVEAYDYRVNI